MLLYGSALALRRVKELIFGYVLQGDFRASGKRGSVREEEKGLSLGDLRN